MSEEKVKKRKTFIKEFLTLCPFFLLHLSSGMTGSFTSILIDHYSTLSKKNENSTAENNKDMIEAAIGTFQDIPPVIMAILGGFLQQLFGPKKLLIASAVPNIFSWILVALNPSSITFLLLSRVAAGLASGLLSGNVYLSNISSPKYIGSFKMIEVLIMKF